MVSICVPKGSLLFLNYINDLTDRKEKLTFQLGV